MDIREEFEKLEEIANLISESDAYFADESIYFCDNDFACGYLNGAWYAFQEQQNKIDKFTSHLRTVLDEYYLTDYYNPDTCRSAELLLLMPSIYTDDELKIEIQELLK